MTIAATDIGASISLPPERAIQFLERKQAQVTGPWTEWLDGQHARGFTAANVTKLDVLQDIQDSLVRALKDGQTLQQWKDGLVPTLQKKGWLGRDYSAEQLARAGRLDAATGEIRKGLMPTRLANIFQTNMQSAYMAGRYGEMIEQVEERPFWGYVAVLDSRTRPAHRALHGRIFRYDDPGWRVFYPTNGFGCRCRVRNFSRREIVRRKLTVDSTEGKLHQVQVPQRDGTTATVTRYTDPSLPGGRFQPDAGFSNNPGLDAWQPRLEPLDAAFSRRYVETAVAGPGFERFVKGQDQGMFPVAVLRPAERAALSTEATVAYLSSESVSKQLEHHPEITVDDYRQIPAIVDDGDAYVENDTRLIYLTVGDVVYRLSLKATRNRRELYILSLIRTTRELADRQVASRRKKV